VTVTATAPVSSLEASLILVALQGGRESTGGSDLNLRQAEEGQALVPWSLYPVLHDPLAPISSVAGVDITTRQIRHGN
jgi:hypothetical protein